MLKVNDLKVSYGMIEAVKGVSFELNEGEIVSLIGSNGAGKTTIMHTLSGLLKPSSGKVFYHDKDLLKCSAEEIVKLAIAQVPEGRRIFNDLSVYENLILGAYLRKDNLESDFNRIYELFPILKQREKQQAGTLSGGEQQMLAMARALMTRPKIMLLDEPSMGLSPLLVKEIFKIIKEINDSGTSIFLVEQNANMALSISNRAYVLETGKIVLSGTGEELLNNEEVRKAYLGG